jgi:hypothetical protein
MTTTSKSPSIPNPTPLRPKDESPEDKGEANAPCLCLCLCLCLPKGPKHPSFPTPGLTSRGHPCRPDPGSGNDNGGGGHSGSKRPPAGGDPGDHSDLDNDPGPGHNPEMDREGDSPPPCHSAMPAGYDWSQLDMFSWDPNPTHI